MELIKKIEFIDEKKNIIDTIEGYDIVDYLLNSALNYVPSTNGVTVSLKNKIYDVLSNNTMSSRKVIVTDKITVIHECCVQLQNV